MRPLVPFLSACLALPALAGCSSEPCPDVQHKSDGTYVIASPAPKIDPTGCEYQIEDSGRMVSERDSD